MLPDKLKTKVLPKTRSQFSAVKKLLLSADVESVVCATDSGREGELIFRYLYRQAGCRKPFRRLWINSMTDAAIKEGFARLRPSEDYDALYVSARCRSEADWLVGMNATRAFTLRYDALLSIGRVQTPTLALIVARDKAIESFVPRDYWELRADFGDYTGLWQNPQTKETRSFERAPAQAAKDDVLGKPAAVAEVTREEKRARPPQLYDLTSLQREANTRYGLSAKKTLDIAQSLYEKHKLLTYPRTDSRCLPDDMAPSIAKTLASAEGDLAPFAQALLPQPPRPKRVYDNAKISDHHAIVPTGARASGKPLSVDEAHIYDMVFRRLVAALYPDYEYISTHVVTLSEGHRFLSSGTVPVKQGWKALYASDKKEDEDQQLPDLQKGDARVVKKATLDAKKEKPPSRMTTASLLTQMEQAGRDLDDEELRESMKDSGLGTPATRAAIIERLKDVGYIREQGKTLTSTEKGRNLIAVAPKEITSAETTGRWERALNRMARSGANSDAEALADTFMASIRRYAAFLVEAADKADGSVHFEREEKRGSRTRAASSTASAAEGSAKPKRTRKTSAAQSADGDTKPKRTRTTSAAQSADGDIKPKRARKTSAAPAADDDTKPKRARSVLPEQIPLPEPPALEPRQAAPAKRRTQTVPGAHCPLCGGDVLETDRAFGCARWRSGCGFTVWKNAAERRGGRAIGREDFLALLQGESRDIGGITTRLQDGKLRQE